MVLYPKLRVEVPEYAVVELLSIVKDEYSRYPVPADNVSPNETPNVPLHDNGQGFYLHPLCEIVNANYQDCCQEGAHDV